MINVTLKAKHFYFIADMLKNSPASIYFDLLNRIRTATTGVLDEDDVSVSSSVQDVLSVYSGLTLKPEGQVSDINTQMSALLAAQIQANVGNPEWDELATKITDIRTGNLSVTGFAIQTGKLFLHP